MPRKKKPLVEDVKDAFTSSKPLDTIEYIPQHSYYKGSIMKKRISFYTIASPTATLMLEGKNNIFEALVGTDATALHLLSYIVQALVKNTNTIELKTNTLNTVLGVNHGRIARTIEDLIDREILARVPEHRNMYFVNPHFLLKGNPTIMPEVTTVVTKQVDLNSNQQKEEYKRYQEGMEDITDEDLNDLLEP